MIHLTLILSLFACGGETTSAPEPAPAAEPAPEPKAEPAPAADAEPVVADAPADAEAGAKVYKQYCEACHQADGSGMNGMLAANFKEEGRLAKSDAELLISIRDGFTGKVGVMPPWGTTLNSQDIVNVLAHVRKTYGE